MLTIPMIDWVAKLGPNRSKLASFSIAKYGRADRQRLAVVPGRGQRRADQRPVRHRQRSERRQRAVQLDVPAGLGAAPGQPVGHDANGGVRYYILDNEPSIWHSTHRDVHPTGATMEEIRNKMLDYAREDQGRRSVGARRRAGGVGLERLPLQRLTTSSTGASTAGASSPIATITAGADYLPWLLDQLRQNNTATGQRLLDVFTVHYYPQGGEFSDDVSSAMQLRRNRSTRSLWDPNYVDETWINDRVQLIPRLQELGQHLLSRTRRSASPNTTGAPRATSTARRRRRTSTASSAAKGWTWRARWTTPATHRRRPTRR